MKSQWNIVYSNQARSDLLQIDHYIRYNLFSPQSAKRLINRIMNMIDDLAFMPNRYQLYKDEPWHSLGLRYIPVGNYTIFYYPNKSTNVIQIIRIMYGGQNIPQALTNSLK